MAANITVLAVTAAEVYNYVTSHAEALITRSVDSFNQTYGDGMSIEALVFTLLHSPGYLIIPAILKSALAARSVNYGKKPLLIARLNVIIEACRRRLLSAAMYGFIA